MKMVKGIYVLLTMFLLIGCATVMNPYKWTTGCIR